MAALAAWLLVVADRGARSELLPLPLLPAERTLWTSFEILSAEPSKPLPPDLRQIEGGRLFAEEANVNGALFRKTSIILPLPSGDRREQVILFADEGGKLRMLGFHRIHRHLDSPQGKTLVFESGAPNPLNGDPAAVPADTYTYLAFTTALSSAASEKSGLSAHLWLHPGEAPRAEIELEAKEKISALGTRVAARRIRVSPESGGAEAFYWLSDAPPHFLLQYKGPGDFLIEDGQSAPTVLLRATASSEQIRKIFEQ